MAGAKRGKGSAAARDYPPLAIAALCMVLLLVLLPSSLNLPQSNPAETLEYAPVPPEGDEPPPASGNFSSLGMARSRSGGIYPGSEVGDTPEDNVSGGVRGRGKNPSTKRCVGSPPRQTEDRLSPPCVAHFSGSNHGATYAGVTPEEIRVLVYTEGSQTPPASPPCNTWYDLDDPPSEDEPVNPWRDGIGALARYFNDRFQTYNRRVHFWIHATCGATPEERRADAIAGLQRIKPFATISNIYYYRDAYQDYMGSKGVLSFGSYSLTDEADHLSRPGLIWGHYPTIERLAANYVSFVCRQVVPYPVSLSEPERGKKRRFGLLFTDEEYLPEMRQIRDIVERKVRECGGDVVVSRGQGNAGIMSPSTIRAENMAVFRDQGVTTVLAVGESETGHTQAAAAINYRPEWIALGQTNSYEYEEEARDRDQDQWRGAVLVTPDVRKNPPPAEPMCATATREGDPEVDSLTPRIACGFYPHMFQLFTGIQVAGPKLTPQSMEKGFRAIPSVASDDPYTPACFYQPGDYTCVKDMTYMWWDPDAPATDAISGAPTTGCWRMREEGKRYLAGGWRQQEVGAGRRPNDPCTYSPG